MGLLKKAADGASAKDLTAEALANATLFTFGELLELPVIQSSNVEKRTLEIFCYGTWKDYQKSGLPALDEGQTRKLKWLTLASLAARHGELSYELLRGELEIAELRELEDLVLDAIYLGIIGAKIDQQRQRVIVDFAI